MAESFPFPAVVVFGPDGVTVISGPEVAVLDRGLREALHLGWGARRAVPPQGLLDHAITVNIAAGQVPGPEPAGFRPAASLPPSDEPVILVTEAARRYGVSAGYVRRLARRRDIEARRDGQGAWLVRADSLAAWDQRRRREKNRKRDRKAA